MSDVAAAPARVSLPEHCPLHPERACTGICERCGVFLCVACRHPRTQTHCHACAPRDDLREPRGIGGWLLVSLLGLLFQPLQLFAVAVPIYVSARHATWDELRADEPWLFTSAFNLVTIGGLTLYALFLLVGFLQKRRWLPRHMQYFYALTLLVVVLQEVVQSGPTLKGGALIPRMVVAVGVRALWIRYFQVSERVRNTFVN
ncbi:DUF2569 family protein [Myxococcaceae bacterium GXIMD 01537]